MPKRTRQQRPRLARRRKPKRRSDSLLGLREMAQRHGTARERKSNLRAARIETRGRGVTVMSSGKGTSLAQHIAQRGVIGRNWQVRVRLRGGNSAALRQVDADPA
jgi:hypothetical protein